MTIAAPGRRVAMAAVLLLASASGQAAAGIADPSPVPSAGSASRCSSLLPGDHTVHVDVDGTEREVLVHVPPGAGETGARLPLVIAFHGFTAYDWQLAESAQLGPIADADGFVVMYPQGMGGLPSWYWPGGPTGPPAGVDDIRFVEVLLDVARGEGCLDMARVVVMGHSMGGGMADAVACELTDRVAGVVEVSAVRFGTRCAPTRPVPIVALHATDDPVLPYAGGRIPGTPADFPPVQPVEAALSDWAMRDGCTGGPVTTAGPDGGAVLAWQGCAAPVVLHRRSSGGHGYPPFASQLVRAMVGESGAAPVATAGPGRSSR